MPIGKNSLKRVTNNGYSAVKTAAPDMENSTVVTEPAATEPTTKVAPVSKKTTAKKAATAKADTKPAAKAAPKADKPEEKKPATKSTAKKPKAEAKPATKKPTAKAEVKTATKKASAKVEAKPENKIPRAPETASRIIAKAEGEKGYCNLGDELPVHLL